MNANVGRIDRSLRIVAGLLLLGLGIFVFNGTVPMVLAIVFGAVMLITGLASRCPLYYPFGISTRHEARLKEAKS